MSPLNCFFLSIISYLLLFSAVVSETLITPYKCDLMTVPFLPYFIANAANQRSDNDVLTCAQCNVCFVKKKKNHPQASFKNCWPPHQTKGKLKKKTKKTILKLELFRCCPQYTAWFNCCANQNQWQLKKYIFKMCIWSRKLEKQIWKLFFIRWIHTKSVKKTIKKWSEAH